MTGQQRLELAARAGVEAAAIDHLVELGLLRADGDGDSDGNLRRVRIVESLRRAGLPLDALAEAIRRGELSLDFVDQPAYERFDAFADVTFRELSARTNIPVELLTTIREAMGFAQPDVDDRVREGELPVVELLPILLDNGVRPATIERTLRVAGESLRRMAETEGAWWATEVQQPLLAAGRTGAEIGQLTQRLATDLAQPTDRAILAIYHGQQANSWMKNILEGFEFALERSGLHTTPRHPPAICFLDLTGYTRLTEERGDEAGAELASRLARLVQRASALHGGKPVKWLGDGVMFHFPHPGRAVSAALDMVEAAVEADLPPAHVGVNAGPVLFQEGDYFGRTVNVAARIADYARQGEVLVSQAVVDAGEADGISFDEIGPVELKGVAGTVRLHVARRRA